MLVTGKHTNIDFVGMEPTVKFRNFVEVFPASLYNNCTFLGHKSSNKWL